MKFSEVVAPEYWPLALRNLSRTLKPAGYVYFTLEITAEEDLAQAFADGQRAGLPVVYGEWAQDSGYHADWAQDWFYHYYPTIAQVKAWMQQAGFQLHAETVGEEYHHFLAQRYEACYLTHC